ncbi:MAG: tryptophan--tRNA ligase [Nanoarchaeota archaeon]|nr:tryptophan--tRNA ligase [Nanoarchaeota archaeon]MBU1027476.1 tryptophan--tRNA ligase [Nanoarchaeota archaeon]
MDINNLEEDNRKLVEKFGAVRISKLGKLPQFYTFQKNLIYSHRDFDKFFSALKKGEKCAILSGFNASGTIHLGHKPVFDTNLFFQKKYKLPVFIPISDDESYITGKVKDQEEALKNSLELAKELIAYGFDPKNTFFIIDQIYTDIYNFAVKLSKKITLSEIKATYGYKNEDNPGMYFYPAVQSAHVLFPQEKFNIKNVLVIIGPDEDAHIRISRDVARKFGYRLPAILHSFFLPGIDGKKMSKSKNNAIFLNDSLEVIKKKVNRAFSGGAVTAEEQRKKGADSDKDVSCFYLTKLFLDEKQSKNLVEDYKSGKILTKDVKERLFEELSKFVKKFQSSLKKVSKSDLDKSILRN